MKPTVLGKFVQASGGIIKDIVYYGESYFKDGKALTGNEAISAIHTDLSSKGDHYPLGFVFQAADTILNPDRAMLADRPVQQGEQRAISLQGVDPLTIVRDAQAIADRAGRFDSSSSRDMAMLASPGEQHTPFKYFESKTRTLDEVQNLIDPDIDQTINLVTDSIREAARRKPGFEEWDFRPQQINGARVLANLMGLIRDAGKGKTESALVAINAKMIRSGRGGALVLKSRADILKIVRDPCSVTCSRMVGRGDQKSQICGYGWHYQRVT
jgi:hypothetical protein